MDGSSAAQATMTSTAMRRNKAGGICTRVSVIRAVWCRDCTTLFEKRKMLHGKLPGAVQIALDSNEIAAFHRR
jgi:hypothetical protein